MDFMKDKHLKYFFIFYFIYYISMGVFFPFVNVHYEQLGFSGSQIGSINSLSLLFAMASTPIWGAVSDKTQQRKSMIAIAMFGSAISVYFWNQQYMYIGVLGATIVFTVFRCAINPLSDSLTVNYCSRHHHDFGKIRAIGSFGYVIGSFIIANIASYLGYDGPFIFIYILMLLISVSILIKYPKVEVQVTKEKTNFVEDIKVLLKNKRYIFIITLMMFTNLAMDSAGGYVGNHIVNTLGAKQSMIGVYTLIAALPEVFFIMIVSNIIQRFGYKKLYITAACVQIIRCLVYAFTSNIVIFLSFTLVHMVMTGVGSVGHLNYMNKVVDSRIMATALSVYTSVYLVVQALYTQLFGLIYEKFGSYNIFLIAAILSVIGLIMILRTKKFESI